MVTLNAPPIHTQWLRYKNKWTAFTTIQGLDIYELGDTEKEAKEALTKRIERSEFLMKGITIS